jgi:2-oxoglutarate dehydrogenase complex dehydrogenase (E1) component-like enzyme
LLIEFNANNLFTSFYLESRRAQKPRRLDFCGTSILQLGWTKGKLLHDYLLFEKTDSYEILQVLYRGRPAMAAPAVGYGKAHKQQAEEVIASPFAP